MSGKKKTQDHPEGSLSSGCDPKTIIKNHKHKHSLLCEHSAYLDKRRDKLFYVHGDELHENCDCGETHMAKICLKHEFTKVADPDEDCSLRDDCHLHIKDDGTAELHHPPEKAGAKATCQVVATFKRVKL